MTELVIDAVLRAATAAEISEGLERNPGSARLREKEWWPAWFEMRAGPPDRPESEHQHSLVWGAPGTTPQELAQEQLELALEEALRNLRDMDGLDVWVEDVDPSAVKLRIEL